MLVLRKFEFVQDLSNLDFSFALAFAVFSGGCDLENLQLRELTELSPGSWAQ